MNIDWAEFRRVMADSQMAIWDDVAVELTAHVDVGVGDRSSSGMDSVLFACGGLTLGTEGGKHIEGTACLDLLWRQAI